jgi:hypothetical protein
MDFVYWLVGVLLVIAGATDLGDKPYPAEFLLGNALVVPGGALVLVGITKRNVCAAFTVLWGGALVYVAVDLLLDNTLTVECPELTYSSECLPCGNCGNGQCDEGINGTGICFCDPGWDGDQCERCDDRHKGTQCERCKRQFVKDQFGICSKCRFGYTGDCQTCQEGFLQGQDDRGALCDQCLPGRWGSECKPCPDCNTFDKDATCNENANVGTFTSSGIACEYNHQCASGRCRGYCEDGSICYEDEDCENECVGRTCGLEFVVGDGTCRCSEGYASSLCLPCPNYDQIYLSSVCAGHGACLTTLSDQIRCECQENWEGDMCQKTEGDCAEGFYGEDCAPCPGGGGVNQCFRHGRCDDGRHGTGLCFCDQDDRPGGVGFYAGNCDQCMGEFYSHTCRPCPFLFYNNGYQSCLDKQCDDGKLETGLCQ